MRGCTCSSSVVMETTAGDRVCADFLEWLADCGHVDQLQQQCRRHRDADRSPSVFKFQLTLDPCQLLQCSAELGDILLHTPQRAWRILQKVCFATITTLEWLPSLRSPSQLLLVLRLASLPDLPGYSVVHASELPAFTKEPRFYLFTGVVCGMSTLEKYTQNASFHCLSEGCTGGNEQYIRLHVAGSTEARTIRGDFCCHYCGGQLVEDVSQRTLADKLRVNLVPVEALSMSTAVLQPSSQQRYQALSITLRDELCGCVRMGGLYHIIGVPVYEPESDGQLHMVISTSIEANNVLSVVAGVSPALSTLPPPVLELCQACKYSPWAFSATLAYSFAAELSPPGAYHRLKLAMLLSLVSTSPAVGEGEGSKQHSSSSRNLMLDVLAVGSDTRLLYQQLLCGSSLSARSLVHSPAGGGDLYGHSRRDKLGVFLDGGSLTLAEGGVCLVGDLSCCKKDFQDKLQKTLETEQVCVSLPKRLVTGDLEQASWPLSCMVWATADQSHRSRAFAKADVEVIRNHSMHETTNISKALTDHFALVVMNDVSYEADDHLTQLLTQHTLDAASGHMTNPPLSRSNIKQLVELCRGCCSVRLSEEASRLLHSFYLASRRVRGASQHGTAMPVAALDHMTSIAIAHAKLSLRRQAEEADAVMAILLYEESLTSRLGYSVLDLTPSPHFKDDNIGAYLGKEFDASLQSLHKRILQFCHCHTYTMAEE